VIRRRIHTARAPHKLATVEKPLQHAPIHADGLQIAWAHDAMAPYVAQQPI
jgi:hypothetical protein